MDKLVLFETPAVVIAARNGDVIGQNRPAQRLLGAATGQSCWKVVGGLKDAEGLPCSTGCVGQLFRAGVEKSRHTRFRRASRHHDLSCIPANGVVVCTLTHDTDEPPEKSQDLTPRQLDVLESLARGENTPSAARRLGIRESTLRSHVETMRTKLGVNTRAALVALGFRHGYLS